MFKLFCLLLAVAFAAAAPAPEPKPGAIIGAAAPLVTSYSSPIITAPLAYSAYNLPSYSYSAIPAALPYAYKSYATYVV